LAGSRRLSRVTMEECQGIRWWRRWRPNPGGGGEPFLHKQPIKSGSDPGRCDLREKPSQNSCSRSFDLRSRMRQGLAPERLDMARRANQLISIVEHVNLLLCTAWDHGARHVSLRPRDDGMEITFLGADGDEHTERLSLSYTNAVKRLREMSARLGRVRVDMGGRQWHFDAVVPATRHPERVFLHMRPEED
jgi:hypothetical protein